MSRRLRGMPPAGGTRFRLFPQPPFLGGVRTSETIVVSSPAGSLGPGPSDARMVVIDPAADKPAYGIAFTPSGTPRLYLPPWDGPLHPPALPDPNGHFDHLEVGTPEFEAAHAFGTIRFVLDVWETYFGRPIRWHFDRDYPSLEITLNRNLNNALAGYGFIEAGADIGARGEYRPFSLSFDVIAHEVGHLIAYSEVGMPDLDTAAGEQLGFQEAAADLVSLIALLHFGSVIGQLLESSRGNLYTFNLLNRFGELSDHEQIRLASNPIRLSDFKIGWHDEHDLAEPLIGAMFDILVDIFHERLLERGLISPEVEDLADELQRRPEFMPLIQAHFDAAYPSEPAGFEKALRDARDDVGLMIAATLAELPMPGLRYDDVGETMLAVDRALTGGRYQRLIVNNFRWRRIGAVDVGPRLSPPTSASHAFSVRTVRPENDRGVVPRRPYHRDAATAAARPGMRRNRLTSRV